MRVLAFRKRLNREKQERRAGCGKDCKVWAAQEEGEGGLCF